MLRVAAPAGGGGLSSSRCMLTGADGVQVASLFLRELEFARAAVHRNNLLIILTDMSVSVLLY